MEKSSAKPLSWEYIAAFFDGEGSIDVTVRKCSIDIGLRITTQVDQRILDEIKEFMRAHGVTGLGVYLHSRNKHHIIHALAISTNQGVQNALDNILPFLRVKRVQSEATLNYLRDKITGNEFITIINAEVCAGRRAGRVRQIDQAFTRGEGIRISRDASLSRAHAVYYDSLRSADVHERLRLSVVERSKRRGLETRMQTLRLLAEESKTTDEMRVAIGRSTHHTLRLLRDSYARGHIEKQRRAVNHQFIYTITEKGRSYLSQDAHQIAGK